MVNRTTHTRTIEPSSPPMPTLDMGALFEASRPSLSAAAEMNDRLYETMAAFNTGYVSFLNRRLKEDLAMPQQFAACRTMEDVFGVYTGFFKRAVEHYQAEFENIAKLGQTLASDTANHMQDQSTRTRHNGR